MPVDSPVGYFGIGFLTIKPRSGLTVHHVKPDSQRIELDSQGCHLFVILAPELFHHDTGLICNCTSWQSSRMVHFGIALPTIVQQTGHHDHHASFCKACGTQFLQDRLGCGVAKPIHRRGLIRCESLTCPGRNTWTLHGKSKLKTQDKLIQELCLGC